MSDRGVYVFEVKDGIIQDDGSYVGDESAWIYCQPTDSELSIVGGGHLSIRLAPGTPEKDVRDLAQRLRKLGATIQFTPSR